MAVMRPAPELGPAAGSSSSPTHCENLVLRGAAYPDLVLDPAFLFKDL
ncbi:MAG: hypothetical protein JO029_15875 [Candidatus Eremiobacteraeota bacterium]|nr:hypothetical protein [Candidatus Eremiobacteraeota bacterium]MBV8435760.1 hypothetical protein [Candidatus Eremiobacteraeota bacterium]MBV8723662.1 hypothetical protein [Candidatus Eremiobacteraeota bacterium]